MKNFQRVPVRALFAGIYLAGAGWATGAAHAAVVWNESVNGNISSTQTAPTAITLSPGANSIIGTVGTGRLDAWLDLTVPAGDVLSSDVLAAFTSTDMQGFTGVQAGNAFVGSINSPASYLGYTHFGTGATNGSLPVTNLIGADLLPLMGNTSLAAGSAGFTPPLPAGNYAFLIQQLGAPTAYQFDFGVTAAPEPATLGFLGIAGTLLLLRRRTPAK